MTITYNLAPIPEWSLIDKTGRWNAYGELYTYKATSKSVPKPTYQDKAGLIPYPNPIILDGVGSIGPIYWASDEDYYVELREPSPAPGITGALIWAVNNFNSGGSGGSTPVSTEIDYENYILDGQFRFLRPIFKKDIPIDVSAETSIYLKGSSWPEYSGQIVFSKANTTASDNITLKEFIPGQTTVEANPRNYIQYNCTVAGVGEGYKRLSFATYDAISFENKIITFSVWLKSLNTETINISYTQSFGTGGSEAVTETITQPPGFIISSVWKKYSITATIGSTVGKTFGPGDKLSFHIDLPLDRACTIEIANVQLNLGDKILSYEYLPFTFEEVRQKALSIDTPPLTSNPVSYNGFAPTYHELTSRFMLDPILPIGAVLPWFSEVLPNWYNSKFTICNGQAIAKNDCRLLYDVLGTKYGINIDIGTQSIIDPADSSKIIIENNKKGDAAAPIDHGTGFTFHVDVVGTTDVKQKVSIICKAASTFSTGSYFILNTAADSYGTRYPFQIYAVKDYCKITPAGTPGTFQVPFYVSSSSTASQVAAALYDAIEPLVFRIPDLRGAFLRFVDAGLGRDPDAATRTNRGDGTGGDVVGTWQSHDFLRHNHPLLAHPSGTAPEPHGIQWIDMGGYYGDVSGFTGGHETRPLNIYCNGLMRIK